MTNDLTPTQVQTLLEWAGMRLVALPVRGLKPANPSVLWPDYSQDKFEILDYRGRLPLRAGAPSKNEIPIMDKILLLPNVIQRYYVRRVIQLRSLVHPITGKYIESWSSIARIVQSDRKTIRLWHAQGLTEISHKADPALVCQIRTFFIQAADFA